MKVKARVGPLARHRFRGWIAVKRDEPATRSQCIENAQGVSSAPEGCVEVDAVGFDRQRGHGFLEQDRDVIAMWHQSEKPSSSGGRPPAGNATACAVRPCHCSSSQSSNLLPCPTSTTCLSSVANWRSAGG